ncbi:MAG: hypothetical protein UR94_C0002G0012 [Parcubacteria group bacterium GW2011_GWA2_36_10]|nr:MAG: hypothetical protein UR94_C0002G0012 [Parcubacteria group bacterium GW2011_GWA2_36_10]
MNKWDQIFANNPQYKPLNEIFLAELLAKIKKDINSNPKKMVDLGCGTAKTVFQFSKLSFEVIGLDNSIVALKKLQEEIDNSQTKNISLINVDLNNYNLAIEADIFLCNFVYAFIDNKEFFLKKVAECLHDNSVFILITPVIHKGIIYTEEDKTKIAVDFEETLKLLKNIFSSIDVYHHDYISSREDYVTFLIKK